MSLQMLHWHHNTNPTQLPIPIHTRHRPQTHHLGHSVRLHPILHIQDERWVVWRFPRGLRGFGFGRGGFGLWFVSGVAVYLTSDILLSNA